METPLSILDQSEIKSFIKDYVAAIRDNNAAIFSGAGLSIPSGYVNWRELMRDIAHDLGLDVDKETDLISIAQYHVNERNTRNRLSEKLITEFTKDAKPTQNHKLLAGMPIEVYWTTNYDDLIEKAIKEEHKSCDVKRTQNQLAVTKRGSQVTVYKMHGDIAALEDAVLTKDDYETYESRRKLFSTCLQGDLISKTFLFLGFSFDDPNLEYILSRIRMLLGEHKREHFCLMKRINENDFSINDFENEQERHDKYIYESAKQDLRIRDLKRYGIKVLYLNTYAEITEILSEIASKVKRETIFISGSAAIYTPWELERSEQFITDLSKELIKQGWNIISGFGIGVGNFVISGAIGQLYEANSSIEERLKLYPFPQAGSGRQLWTQYREDMLSHAGIAIFLFGNKHTETGNAIALANGMREEFQICLKKGVIPIPIGATGYMSAKLWQETLQGFDRLCLDGSFRNLFQELNKAEYTDSQMINTVIEIIKKLNR